MSDGRPANATRQWYEFTPFTFPSMTCPRCNSKSALDPDRLYCDYCIEAMALEMAEEVNHVKQ